MFCGDPFLGTEDGGDEEFNLSGEESSIVCLEGK